MVDDPDTSARSLARAISSDQVLTARVLKLANSSFYGFQQKVGTVSLALVVLGFQAVKDLALATSVTRAFRNVASDPRFDMRAFWNHAVSVGVASRHLSRTLRVGAPGEAFTAGILHDIGQVVLREYHPDAFEEALRLAAAEELPIHEAETSVLGAGHPQVGGWLCRRWNLPDPICRAVEGHHGPFGGAGASALASIVGLADHLASVDVERGREMGQDLDPDCLAVISAVGSTVAMADLPLLLEGTRAEVERCSDLLEAFR
jgi:HD-like signal output (HDOD) protein